MPSKPLLIGITGGIGSGKSTVCHVFEVLGVPVYDADERAKFLVATDPEIKKQLLAFFGTESFVDGKYNKTYIAQLVFQSPEKLAFLNKLIHPAVGEDFKRWVTAHAHFPYLIKEAALMFDSGSSKQLDKIIVVHAPDTMRIARVKERDPQRSEAQIKAIISNQLSQEEMMNRADFLVDNSGKESLIPQVIELDDQFRSGHFR